MSAPIPDAPVPDLIPARMLNEAAYCPRLFHLEWVQRQFAPSADTAAGTVTHTRVDRPDRPLPEPGDDLADTAVRSVSLSSDRLGMSAVIDLVEGDGGASPCIIAVQAHRLR